MASRAKNDKGYLLEELLRAYFLRAGFFVVRSVPFQHAGDDLSDVDLWLYERPTGSSRRRQIVDAKSKTRPKAVERIFWTKGLAEFLAVEGAYVATTDARPMLRDVSKKLGMSLLDGADIRRISESDKVLFPERISEETLISDINVADGARRGKEIFQILYDVKNSLIESFGTGSLNRGLEGFAHVSLLAVTAHQGSDVAKIATRLCYFVAAVIAISIDYVVAEVSFRTAEERRKAVQNAIRYGNIDERAGLSTLRLAVGLLDKYGPKGAGTARAIESAIKTDLNRVPAEIIAEYVIKNTRSDELFQAGRAFEREAYLERLRSFDELAAEEKSFISVLLDFADVDRVKFANAWGGSGRSQLQATQNDGPLFEANRKQ